MRAASEGDGEERSKCNRYPASDLHFVLPLLCIQTPRSGDVEVTMGDTRLADKGDVYLRALL